MKGTDGALILGMCAFMVRFKFNRFVSKEINKTSLEKFCYIFSYCHCACSQTAPVANNILFYVKFS